ncbi:MAG: aspartate kinase [Lentisphaeria bacterium]|nr:aspartate kinase [Lentisphaeria bacterium]
MGEHTIEKIGGTSMSRFGEVMKNVIIGSRQGAELYQRAFVVSAYSGITNALLEDKKTGAPGVYGFIQHDSREWEGALEKVRAKMLEYNRSFADLGLDVKQADDFVNERLDGIRSCLKYIMYLRTAGHSKPSDYLPATREFLAAVGEAHSAFNSTMILKANGVNARFVDLTGWMSTDVFTLDEAILNAFKDIDFATEMPIVTGYVKYDEGIMRHYDRGYSEITFSRLAVLTGAREGIIHKEFHLSTGDPKLMGVDKVQVIGNTNFDIADQLSDMDMEAIHSKAAKDMELRNIPIRIKNAFDPEHPGTLISRNYVSPVPRAEMICGRSDVIALEVHDPEMVSEIGYDYKLCRHLADNGISYIAKNTNANTITHYVPQKAKNLERCREAICQDFPHAEVHTRPVAIVSVIGTNMKIPGFLARAAKALYEADINVLALDQVMRQVNIQFIVDREDFTKAQIALHREFVEKSK